VYIAELKIM